MIFRKWLHDLFLPQVVPPLCKRKRILSVDLTGKKAGRGAYICKNIECLEKAFKAKRLSRNLDVAIDEEIYNKLRDEIVNE